MTDDKAYWLREEYERLLAEITELELALYLEHEPEWQTTKELAALNATLSEVRRSLDQFERSERDGYSLHWWDTSRITRDAANWRCAHCRINLRDRSNLLHVHHINRNRTDNRPENLRVLCVLCHSQEDGHVHLLASIRAEDRDYIESLQRVEQSFLESLLDIDREFVKASPRKSSHPSMWDRSSEDDDDFVPLDDPDDLKP